MKEYKICIVEDNPEFRQWLVEEIEEAEGFRCVADFEQAMEALKYIPSLEPDAVIMDLGLDTSDYDGIECMLRLKLVNPELKFMVVSSFSHDDKVFEALRVGAGAYILKDEIPDNLISVLKDFVNNGSPMTPTIAQKLVKHFHQPIQELDQLQKLSPREIEILELIAKGYLNKEIKEDLGIAENTVKVTTYNIYRKLQVNNRVEAVKKYLNMK